MKNFLLFFVTPLWSLYVKPPLTVIEHKQHIVAPSLPNTHSVLTSALSSYMKEKDGWNVIDFSNPGLEESIDQRVTHIPLVAIAQLPDTDLSRAFRSEHDLSRASSGEHDLSRASSGEHDLSRAFRSEHDLSRASSGEHDLSRAFRSEHHRTTFQQSPYAEVLTYPQFCVLEKKMARIVFAYLGDTRRHWMVKLDPLFLYSDSVRRYGKDASTVTNTMWVTPSATIGVPDAIFWKLPDPPHASL